MATGAERLLQHEIALRLKTGHQDCVCLAVPNSIWIPARTPQEKTLVARLMSQMKKDGMLSPGAPDMIVASKTGTLFLELKRSATRDLFGKRNGAGVLSDAQREFQARCTAAGVPYAIAHTWEEALAALKKHGVISAGGNAGR